MVNNPIRTRSASYHKLPSSGQDAIKISDDMKLLNKFQSSSNMSFGNSKNGSDEITFEKKIADHGISFIKEESDFCKIANKKFYFKGVYRHSYIWNYGKDSVEEKRKELLNYIENSHPWESFKEGVKDLFSHPLLYTYKKIKNLGKHTLNAGKAVGSFVSKTAELIRRKDFYQDLDSKDRKKLFNSFKEAWDRNKKFLDTDLSIEDVHSFEFGFQNDLKQKTSSIYIWVKQKDKEGTHIKNEKNQFVLEKVLLEPYISNKTFGQMTLINFKLNKPVFYLKPFQEKQKKDDAIVSTTQSQISSEEELPKEKDEDISSIYSSHLSQYSKEVFTQRKNCCYAFSALNLIKDFLTKNSSNLKLTGDLQTDYTIVDAFLKKTCPTFKDYQQDIAEFLNVIELLPTDISNIFTSVDKSCINMEINKKTKDPIEMQSILNDNIISKEGTTKLNKKTSSQKKSLSLPDYLLIKIPPYDLPINSTFGETTIQETIVNKFKLQNVDEIFLKAPKKGVYDPTPDIKGDYILKGFIYRIGDTANSGHYITYRKEEGYWYKYDNKNKTYKTIVNIENIKEKEDLEDHKSHPYMMLYTKKTNSFYEDDNSEEDHKSDSKFFT